MSANPYQSPPNPEIMPALAEGSPAEQPAYVDDGGPAVSVAETLMPRLMATICDNVCAMTATYVVAKSISDRYPVLQVIAFISVYFLYFLVLEALTGRTIGKLLTGLVVIQFDGRRITWKQAAIRAVLRFFEVNPVILGALPAGILAWLSPYHQRLGDRLAGTIVVRSWRWRSYKRRMAGK